MVDQQPLDALRQGASAWNAWRKSPKPFSGPQLRMPGTGKSYEVDLRGVDLEQADLEGANFRNANLAGAKFGRTNLEDADFVGANLSDANFANAYLDGANF